MKPQELVRARIAAREVRRRDILSTVGQHCDAAQLRTKIESRSEVGSEPAGSHAVTSSARAHGVTDSDIRLVFDFPVPSETRLRELFDLTAAEARLAQRLACGDSVEEVAQRLSIKMTTARTQLAAIFAKTDTRRQAKLVAILSRVAHLG